jgi:imidazolonepropionase-like amidohydrolase
MHHRFYEELNDMVGSMVSSRVRSVVVCLLSAFLPGPFLVNAPGAKPELAASAVPIAITNVTVIDVVSGARRTGLTVLIGNDRIAAIGPRISVPGDATQVDGKGKFLIPGLWDMHSHHQGTGADSLDLFVAKGIVGTRDMGGNADFILPLRERVRSGTILGPEIVASGPILDDAPPDFPYRRRVTNAIEARQAVHDLKRLGVDFIKVHDHTPREVFFSIANEIPKVGLTFAGHVPMNVTVEEAAHAGMRSIEHLANYRVWGDCSTGDTYSPKECAPLFDKLAAKGVWETPTMAFFQTIPDVCSGAPLAHAEYASDSLLALTRDNVRVSHLSVKTLDKFRLANRLSLPAIHDLQAHGNRFLAGCDGLVPGFCLHDELEWLTKAGLTPLESLQTATINPARFLGREASEGTIETGKRANLVLLEADPTLNIRHVDSIAAVILRGRLLTQPALERMIAKHRRANR